MMIHPAKLHIFALHSHGFCTLAPSLGQCRGRAPTLTSWAATHTPAGAQTNHNTACTSAPTIPTILYDTSGSYQFNLLCCTQVLMGEALWMQLHFATPWPHLQCSYVRKRSVPGMPALSAALQPAQEHAAVCAQYPPKEVWSAP